MPFISRYTGVFFCHIYYLTVLTFIISTTICHCNNEFNLNNKNNIIDDKYISNNYSNLEYQKQYDENLLKYKKLNVKKENILTLKLNESNFLINNTNNRYNETVIINDENINNNSNKYKINQIEFILFDYINETLNKNSYEIISGIELIKDDNKVKEFSKNKMSRSFDETNKMTIDEKIIECVKEFAETHVISVNVPRALETGRLFFFGGLKKLMWPMFVGMQIVKTIMFALFLPSILGSLGKIVGKGLSGFSGLSTPPEQVEELDFKDNTYNSEQDAYNTNDYSYTGGDDAMQNIGTKMYDSAQAAANNVLSRYGPGGQKVTYVNSAANNYYNKYTNSIMGTHTNNFKVFQDIPASSLLLTNYDPFYSPLLSRLDAVFQQLGYGMNNQEKCREKLVCLMYANPAKYAPYSNLISAQLSRELNELRKPTSDNPDILRFFKYMRAAKDGQDGVNCEEIFKECTTVNESNNPVMMNTYNDINKLVQARNFS